jgi:hypothetical protein
MGLELDFFLIFALGVLPWVFCLRLFALGLATSARSGITLRRLLAVDLIGALLEGRGEAAKGGVENRAHQHA